MKILFDQGTPVPLRRYLPDHTITTAYEQGWASLKNGQLLAEAALAGIDLLITADQNLRYQQNLRDRRIAILVLGSTSWPKIQGWIEAIRGAITRVAPGTYEEVPI
ncbi:hypothetical protein [Candidatus Chloroploca sp. Khr17]|uniref:hypothetical protein n=1 Tax=Candidatus Chloroploca sp. Khr17 TaxID=2496869 RepID=UPI00101B707A|nr:hypothetical protein [Candidatus Chloroploca sp. Khr17]